MFGRVMALFASGAPLPALLDAIARAVEAEDPAATASIHLLDEPGDLDELEVVADLPRGVAAAWRQPIRAPDGAALGVFTLHRRKKGAPKAADRIFLEGVAQLAAMAIRLQPGAPPAPDPEQDAAQRLAHFFEVSLDMLCIRDLDGRFVKVSRAWESVLGYPVGELEGAHLLPLVHPDDHERTRGQMRLIQAEREFGGFINRYRHREGHYRHLEWRARRSGELIFAVARDVTDRLAAEAEMAMAKQAAESANQAKSDFLANMSHEIRTPLNGVIGLAAVLADSGLTAPQREMVELIQSSGVTLERLVSDILDVSKIEAGQLDIEARAFDLLAEIEGLLDIARMRAEAKGLAFHADHTALAPGEFWGDSVRIKQVLGNLLSNAVKFTSQGRVSVRIEVTDPEQPRLPAQLTFEVRDSGVGFDADFAALLFQRFSQADTTITRRFGGTGLGLSISKALVELMGGEITAESEPGVGSLFRVVMPLARSEAAPPAPAAIDRADPVAPARGFRVLLAEDNPTNQRVIQLILEPHGARITTVGDGAEAVEAFKAGVFDLVLMDMQMPVMDGLTAIRVIRGHEAANPDRARTPIAMLSANAMPKHRRDAIAAGADLHIAKPVTATGLIGAVAEALDAADRDSELRPGAAL
ncbi:MAG: ATP-binding protein [Phenylobacterium sp.]